jgi:hypothetical protein
MGKNLKVSFVCVVLVLGITHYAFGAPLSLGMEKIASVPNTCTSVLSDSLQLHVPILDFQGTSFWADFQYVPNTLDFTLTNAGLVNDLSPYEACTHAMLSDNFVLHLPTVGFAGNSYWADFSYTGDVTFALMAVDSAYSPTDVAGIWEMNDLASPGPWWSRGEFNIGTDGSFSANLNGSDSSTYSINGTFNMNDAGIITVTGASFPSGILDSLRSVLNSGKTVGVTTNFDSGGESVMQILTKKAASYSMADLAGRWEGNSLGTGPCTPWWERADLTINGDGSLTASTVESTGETSQINGGPGTVSITSDGVITFSGGSDVNLKGSMDAGKTVMVWTGTFGGGCAGGTEMKVFTKKAASYSLADLAGTWEMNDLASPGPWWSRGQFFIRPDGSFYGTSNGSDGSVTPLSGIFSMSDDGIITATGVGIPASFRCVMDSGKTVVVCTSTTVGGQTDMHILTK